MLKIRTYTEMNKTGIILFEISILLVYCFCMTAPPAVGDWRILDSTNLKSLNRETRKALLDLVTRELDTVRQTINTLRPQLLQCQNKTTAAMGKCMDCVDNMCLDRFRECKGKANVVVPSDGGVSVSGQTDSQGRHVVTVCALLQDNSQSCQTMMNPDGVLVSSVENMGDNLMVHLRGAVNDMGGNSVGTFVNGMQTFIGSYRPLSGNGSNIPETELISMLSNMSNQYNAINKQIQSQISSMGEQIEQGMKIFRNALGTDMNQFSSQMNNQMQKLFSSMSKAFNINPSTPTIQQQQDRSTTNNIFQQTWKKQQQDSVLNQQQSTSPFSFQQPINDPTLPNKQRTMFRAPPTTESNFYKHRPSQNVNDMTTPPSIITITSTPSHNNPPLPSVLNLDSIIGTSGRNSVPNVVNINSPVGTFHGQNIPNINIDSLKQDPPGNVNSNIDSSRIMSGLEQIINSANDILADGNTNSKFSGLGHLISGLENITQGRSIEKQQNSLFDQTNSEKGNLKSIRHVQKESLGFVHNLESRGGSIPSVLNIDSMIGRQSGDRVPNLQGLGNLLGDQIPTVVNIDTKIGSQDIVSERPDLPPNFDFLSHSNAGQSNQRISSSGIPNVLNFNSMIGTQNTGQSSGTNNNGVEVLQNNPMVSSILGESFSRDMNHFASNFQHSFSDMFGGGFLGRKKRSVENKRVKRSHLRRPGGVPVGSNPKAGLLPKERVPISKDMYTKTNKWNNYMKGLLPNSVPVRVNPEEGISIRLKKSIGKSLLDRMRDSMRNPKSRVQPPSKSKNAGGLLVYNNYLYETTTVSAKDKTLFSPEMMAMRTNTRTAKRINPRPTTTQRPVMSTYQTSPLKLELERIVRALEAKAKERSLSVYNFDPHHVTTTVRSTKVTVPSDNAKSTMAVQTMDTTRAETTTESFKIEKEKKKPLQIQKPKSLQRKEVQTSFHSVSSLASEKLNSKLDTGGQVETKRKEKKRKRTKTESAHYWDFMQIPTETPKDVLDLIHSMSAYAVAKLEPEIPVVNENQNFANTAFTTTTTTTDVPLMRDVKSAAAGDFFQHTMFQENVEPVSIGPQNFALNSVTERSKPITTTSVPDMGPLEPLADIAHITDSKKQKECGIIYLNATSCVPYRQMCSACADHIDSRKGDILEKVCGRRLVDQMVDLQAKMTALQTIYYQVITSSDIITKVEFDRTSGDLVNLSFPKLRVMANISNRVVNFIADFSLHLLDIPGTGSDMANQIWRLWNDGKTL